MRVGWAKSASGLDYTAEQRHQSAIKEARAALKQGIKPKSTRLHDVREAVSWSQKNGKPFVSDL
jgi:hypothetical protein